MRCDGCASPLNPVEASQWTVCLPCTVARQKAVLKQKCVCRKRDRRPTCLTTGYGRTWVACKRCLGAILG